MAKQTQKEPVDLFRTRWRRWLGNKTRKNEPHWATLLDSSWSGWATDVIAEHCDGEYAGLGAYGTRETVKALFERAISLATMHELYQLDGMYAEDRLSRGKW